MARTLILGSGGYRGTGPGRCPCAGCHPAGESDWVATLRLIQARTTCLDDRQLIGSAGRVLKCHETAPLGIFPLAVRVRSPKPGIPSQGGGRQDDHQYHRSRTDRPGQASRAASPWSVPAVPSPWPAATASPSNWTRSSTTSTTGPVCRLCTAERRSSQPTSRWRLAGHGIERRSNPWVCGR